LRGKRNWKKVFVVWARRLRQHHQDFKRGLQGNGVNDRSEKSGTNELSRTALEWT